MPVTSTRHRALHDPGPEGFFRKSFFVGVGQLSVGFLFVVYILAARALGDAGFGRFSLGMAIASVLHMLPAWGSARYSSIMAARDPDRTAEIVATFMGLTLPLTALYLPLVAGAAALISSDATVVLVALLLGVDQFARALGNYLRYLFRVHDAYPLEALTSFAERGGIVLLAVLALTVRPHPVVLAGAFAVGRLTGALVTGALFRRRVAPIGLRFERAAIRALLIGGTPVALRQGVGLLTFRVDLLFLGAMRAAREVGWYGSVYTIMDGAIMLPQSVNGSFGPTLSASYGKGDLATVRRLYQRGIRYLVTAGLFLGAALAILATPFVALLYGPEYGPAVGALVLLALSIPFVFVRSHTTEVLDNVDLRTTTLRVFAGGLLLNVVLNLVLIPRYGHVGAAASTLATEAGLALAMAGMLASAGYPAGLARQLRAPLLAILPTAATIWALKALPVAALLAGAAIYFLGLTALGAWDEKDRQLLRSVGERLGRRRPPA